MVREGNDKKKEAEKGERRDAKAGAALRVAGLLYVYETERATPGQMSNATDETT